LFEVFSDYFCVNCDFFTDRKIKNISEYSQ